MEKSVRAAWQKVCIKQNEAKEKVSQEIQAWGSAACQWPRTRDTLPSPSKRFSRITVMDRRPLGGE